MVGNKTTIHMPTRNNKQEYFGQEALDKRGILDLHWPLLDGWLALKEFPNGPSQRAYFWYAEKVLGVHLQNTQDCPWRVAHLHYTPPRSNFKRVYFQVTTNSFWRLLSSCHLLCQWFCSVTLCLWSWDRYASFVVSATSHSQDLFFTWAQPLFHCILSTMVTSSMKQLKLCQLVASTSLSTSSLCCE